MTEMLVRGAAPAEVRFAEREIDVRAIPYETATDIAERGRVYVETIARGAFGNVGSRAERIKVLREHNPILPIGRCLRIDDKSIEGLMATLRISPTELGDETLVLAEDGVLDVSCGMSSQGGDQWNLNRSTVRRTNLRLHEISLVALPAYEAAAVLSVRSAVADSMPIARPPTPALDEVRAWMLDHGYSRRANPKDTPRPSVVDSR
jgi:HK97 family phage prohead protease